MGRATKLKVEQEQEIVQKYQQGISLHKIAKNFHISYGKIYKILEANDIEVRRKIKFQPNVVNFKGGIFPEMVLAIKEKVEIGSIVKCKRKKIVDLIEVETWEIGYVTAKGEHCFFCRRRILQK